MRSIADKGKISISQAMMLYLSMTYSPTMRVLASVVIKEAKQAAWLVPLLAFVINFILLYVIYKFFTKFRGVSYGNILQTILGKFAGKVLIVIYIIWFLSLLALYIRYFDDKLTSTIYPNVDMHFFIIIMLILVAIVLRSGLVTLARTNTIILAVLIAQFLLIQALLVPKFDVKFITPISTLDVVPVIKGLVGPLGIWVYMLFILTFNDKINLGPKPKRKIMYAALFILFADTSILFILLGTFGASSLERFSLPLLTSVKYILSDFAGLESIFIMMWTMADFITIAVFTYFVLRMLKDLFKLEEPIRLLNILLIIAGFLAIFICNEIFELQEFSSKIALRMNVIMGFIVPVVVFVIGKIRKLV